MNKFIKGCCIAAVIFIVIGGITLAVSLTFGGRSALRTLMTENRNGFFSMSNLVNWDDDWFWNSDEIYPDDDWATDNDYIYSDDDWVTDNNNAYPDDDWTADNKETYSGDHSELSIATKEEVRDLLVQIGAAKVTITESDNEYFQIKGNTNYPYKCYVENGTLVLKGLMNRESHKWNVDDNFLNTNHITLSIPKDVSFQDVTIEFGGGMLKVESLDTNSITLTGGASNMVIDKLIANYTDVEMGAGNLEIMQADLQDAEFEIGVGNLELEGIITRELSLNCGLGNVIMDLQDSEANHNYELDASAGRISIGSKSLSGLSRDKYINNNANSTYDIECGLGNVSIGFQR